MADVTVSILCADGCGEKIGSVTFSGISADEANSRVSNMLRCNICSFVRGDSVELSSNERAILTKLQPEISSISISKGPSNGGTTFSIIGNKLDKGKLTIKFGNNPALNVRDRTATSATADTPVSYSILNLQGKITGTLSPGDTIIGQTTASSATIISVTNLSIIISGASGVFDNNEWIIKDVNNKVQLARNGAFINQPVDVSVESDKGKCPTNSTLAEAFTYTVP